MKDILDLSIRDRTINITGCYTDDIKLRINHVLSSLDVDGKFYEIPQNNDSNLYYYSPPPGGFGRGMDIWRRPVADWTEMDTVPKSELKYGINIIRFNWKIQGVEVFDWHTNIKKGNPIYEGGFNSVLIKQIGGHFVPTESIITEVEYYGDGFWSSSYGNFIGDYTLIPYVEQKSNKFINWPDRNPMEIKE